jgi:hypothetical protein
MWRAWDRGEKGTRFRWERLEETDHSEDQGVDGGMGSGFIRLIRGAMVGCCECGDEPSGSGATELDTYGKQ